MIVVYSKPFKFPCEEYFEKAKPDCVPNIV